MYMVSQGLIDVLNWVTCCPSGVGGIGGSWWFPPERKLRGSISSNLKGFTYCAFLHHQPFRLLQNNAVSDRFSTIMLQVDGMGLDGWISEWGAVKST